MSITVGPIQRYVPGQTWFDLSKYQNLAVRERVSVNLSSSNLWLVDSKQLYMNQTYAPRVAFINEGAGYQSPVRVSASGATNGSATVFQNLSGSNSILPSSDAPLRLGDWVQLSPIQGGTQLNFSVIPNGVFNSRARALSTDPRLNPVNPANPNSPIFWVAYADPQATRPIIVMGYEDIAGSGSDNDFNDGILAVDLGPQNFWSVFNTANLGQNPRGNLRDLKPVAVPFDNSPVIGLLIVMIFVARKWLLLSRKSSRIQASNHS